MAFQQKDNSGIMGRNETRKKDSHPEFTGNCTIDGREYYIAAWVKEGKKGRFFSMAFKPKEPVNPHDDYNTTTLRKPQRQGSYGDIPEDDIPF